MIFCVVLWVLLVWCLNLYFRFAVLWVWLGLFVVGCCLGVLLVVASFIVVCLVFYLIVLLIFYFFYLWLLVC